MVPVPIWTVAVALVAGLVVGMLIGRTTSGGNRDAARTPEAVAKPEPASAATPRAAPEPEQAAESEPAAAGTAERVDDVVAELERRVRGRRIDPEAEKKPVGNGSGQS